MPRSRDTQTPSMFSAVERQGVKVRAARRPPSPPPTPAEEARDQAMDRAARGARDWISTYGPAISRLVRSLDVFTTDEIWATIPPPETGDKRALGQVMRNLRAAGLIEPTGRYRKSAETTCHARPKAEWRWIGGSS